MASLAQKLTEIVGAAFAAEGLSAELGLVRVSDRPDLCQFQCNGAMAAAKAAKKNPREIAQTLVQALQDHPALARIEIAGPGFINLDVTDAFLAAHIKSNADSDTLGVEPVGAGRTIVLDYGGPNIAKPMHVGHLRSSIIGDSLRRICAFAGYRAIGDVHMGDWGTPMGQILSELEARGRLGQPVTMDELEEIYPAASRACKEDENRAEQARAATVKLQDGDPVYRAAWQQFIDVSIAGMKENFDALGVHFDLWKGESDVHERIAPMVETLKTAGLAVESEGAVVVPVAREDDKKEMPPLILYKRDGAVMYGTTDLATVADRVEAFSPAAILYVVDQRQSLHFEQVFRAARVTAIAPEEQVELTHAGFGTMNGQDGKPFKTRAGGVMKLQDLIAMAVEKAQARLEEADLAADMDQAERDDVAHKVAVAALKFADLHNNRVADYVFDIDRMTRFEGKTGPYLLYQAVRINSLLNKAKGAGLDVPENPTFAIKAEDRALALALAEFPDHFRLALENYTPHVLCDYAYKLAQDFSSFYGACHILSEEDEQLRASRLSLCALTYRQLVLILGLLGIQVPARM
ncbi:MAG: arginine--tRNA ligase [Alphaproteobacteria bacterium]|nr:arginine--tRNA ligase [Alphaproteobacteria bacterium]